MKVLTPIKAIRAKCMDCTCQQRQEVKTCNIVKCPLHPYRMGRRPTDKEIIEYEGLKSK